MGSINNQQLQENLFIFTLYIIKLHCNQKQFKLRQFPRTDIVETDTLAALHILIVHCWESQNIGKNNWCSLFTFFL